MKKILKYGSKNCSVTFDGELSESKFNVQFFKDTYNFSGTVLVMAIENHDSIRDYATAEDMKLPIEKRAGMFGGTFELAHLPTTIYQECSDKKMEIESSLSKNGQAGIIETDFASVEFDSKHGMQVLIDRGYDTVEVVCK